MCLVFYSGPHWLKQTDELKQEAACAFKEKSSSYLGHFLCFTAECEKLQRKHRRNGFNFTCRENSEPGILLYIYGA